MKRYTTKFPDKRVGIPTVDPPYGIKFNSNFQDVEGISPTEREYDKAAELS